MLLGASLRARFAEAAGRTDVEFPEDGYHGAYVVEMAVDLARAPEQSPELGSDVEMGKISGRLPAVEGSPAKWMELPAQESSARFGDYAILRLIKQQRQILGRFGLVFDTWYLESELHATDKLESTLERMRKGDHVYEREGAVWFRSTDFGDEKDRVLVKADRSPTYFLADIAYHASKRDRGFEHAVDIFGPDHHGHIARLSGATQALGLAADWLEILILQQVNLIQDGTTMEMSKRAGRLVTMDQLIEEVGADVAKFFFLVRRNASHLDFDLDLAKKESNENPVYYVKYAHARICSVLRNAEARDFDAMTVSEEDLGRLVHDAELALLRFLPELPAVVVQAATTREMSRLTQYAVDLAQAFHQFYHQCTILGEDQALSRARLALCRASRIVLANTLRLIGVEAPERM